MFSRSTTPCLLSCLTFPLLPLTWILLSLLASTSHAEVGTAARYSPPYLPTECYGDDSTEFPSSNLFAVAGEGIWDNGAACGRKYRVRCISAEQPRTCKPDINIQIKVVDYAKSTARPFTPSATGTTMILSEAAFAAIANSSATLINIEFQQE